MAITQKKDGRWACYYRIKDDKTGKTRVNWEYFGRGPAAEAAANERNRELGLGKRKRRRETALSGPAFVELAKAYLQGRNFSDNSRKQLAVRLAANILPYFGDKPASAINEKALDRYVKHRRKKKVRRIADPRHRRLSGPERKKIDTIAYTYHPVKYTTINRELSDILAILSWAAGEDRKLIPSHPAGKYRKPKNDNEVIIPPTFEETVAIIAAASDHLVRFIKLAYFLGARPGVVEILRLTWDHVNWGSRTIRVISANKGGPPSRSVPLKDSFFEELKAWWEADGRSGPIVHYHGRGIKKIQSSWEGAVKRAGINRRIRPYDLRHVFVTRAIEAGADTKAISEIVGSRTDTIQRHYQHVTRAIHRKTVDTIPDLPD